MELKQSNYWFNVIPRNVLIVPYGIETSYGCRFSILTLVLIVPYGIETHTLQLASTFLSEC